MCRPALQAAVLTQLQIKHMGQEGKVSSRSAAGQEPMPPHRVGPLFSSGFVNLCWQPTGYALYNRPIMTR